MNKLIDLQNIGLSYNMSHINLNLSDPKEDQDQLILNQRKLKIFSLLKWHLDLTNQLESQCQLQPAFNLRQVSTTLNISKN